jgi:hypothetical protein
MKDAARRCRSSPPRSLARTEKSEKVDNRHTKGIYTITPHPLRLTAPACLAQTSTPVYVWWCASSFKSVEKVV